MLREFAHFHPNVGRILEWVPRDSLPRLVRDTDARTQQSYKRHALAVVCTGSSSQVVSRKDHPYWRCCPSSRPYLYHQLKSLSVDRVHHAKRSQMLPFGGQGSNQAIEDAGALGYLFHHLDNPDQIPKRLELFETVRRKQASRVQILSKVRVGKEGDVKQELLKYADPPGSGESGLLWRGRTISRANVHHSSARIFCRAQRA